MRIRLLPAFLAGTLLLPAALSAQTTLLYEDFNGIFPPSGWVIEPDSGPGGWHRAPDHGYHPWTDNTTPYALLYGNSIGPGGTVMISPPVNCEGYNYIVLRCSTNVRTSLGPHFSKLLGSVGGGPFEHVVTEYQGVSFNRLETLDISSWAGGEPEVRLCWRFSGDKVLISYWCVDNVSLTGDDPIPDIGFDSLISWPPDTVDSGSVWPMGVFVKNYGGGPVEDPFALELQIGIGYRDTVLVTDTLEPGQGVRVDFDPWTASSLGWHRILCRFALIGSTEDSIIDSVYVRPSGGIDSEEHRSGLSTCMAAFPNPAHGCVNLALSTPDIRAVRLYDAGGRLLAAHPCLGRRSLGLDVSGLSPGVYFIRAQDQTCRLVIE
jgi:hypothetical protein